MLQQKFNEVILTPYLWNTPLYGLAQFKISSPLTLPYPEEQHPSNLRLGKQIESFVDFELQQHPDIEIISKNLQIIHQKQTIGEIDFLINYKNTPIHLEVVYKFYIYNPKIGTRELEHWMGPNNKDCLIYKLEKLKTKQFPLLYKTETQPYLKALNLEVNNIKQYVYFKAQLFIPYKSDKSTFKHINSACIVGFYITPTQLEQFKDYTFYLPTKHHWIQPLTQEVDWIDFIPFKARIETCRQNKQAPLCWIKNPKGELSKCMVYFED